MKLNARIRFLIKYGLRGLLWLFIILALYLLFKEVIFEQSFESLIEPFYNRPFIVYLIYCVSELFFGLIPPELFMLWAINKGDVIVYLLNLVFFAGASFFFGYLMFLIGHYTGKNAWFRMIRKKYLKSIWKLFRKYGSFMIIVAALTPIPWSGVCLLVGSSNFPGKFFLRYALFRLLRFAVYGFIVFRTQSIG